MTTKLPGQFLCYEAARKVLWLGTCRGGFTGTPHKRVGFSASPNLCQERNPPPIWCGCARPTTQPQPLASNTPPCSHSWPFLLPVAHSFATGCGAALCLARSLRFHGSRGCQAKRGTTAGHACHVPQLVVRRACLPLAPGAGKKGSQHLLPNHPHSRAVLVVRVRSVEPRLCLRRAQWSGAGW